MANRQHCTRRTLRDDIAGRVDIDLVERRSAGMRLGDLDLAQDEFEIVPDDIDHSRDPQKRRAKTRPRKSFPAAMS